jgi:hypothetical protein
MTNARGTDMNARNHEFFGDKDQSNAISNAAEPLALDGPTPAGPIAPASRHALQLGVIGAGAAGASAIASLVQHSKRSGEPLDIYLVDECESSAVGTGIAWAKSSPPELLVNMQIDKVTRRRFHDSEIARYIAELGTSEHFPPRALVGQFLHAFYAQALVSATDAPVRIHHVRGRAIDAEPLSDGRVRVAVGPADYVFDAVVLATGNTPSTAFSHLSGVRGYVRNPWDLAWVQSVPEYEHVLIAGTSVSGVDATVSLIESGHKGKVTLFSRNGRVPGARPLQQDVQLITLREGTAERFVTSRGRSLSIDDLKTMIRLELIAQQIDPKELDEIIALSLRPAREWLRWTLERWETPSALFGLMKALDDVIPELWNCCSKETQKQLAPLLGSFASVQWPMAPTNARRILGYLNRGQLKVRGGCGDPAWNGRRFIVPFLKGPSAKGKILINATGIGGSLDDLQCDLIRSLRRRGVLVPHAVWGACTDFHTGRLLDSFGSPTAPIWATASALTRGTRLLTNELSEACRSADRSASAAFHHGVSARLGRK